MSGDDLLSRVLSGEPAGRHHWDDYYRAFHTARPSATADSFLALRAPDGLRSYDVIATVLPAGLHTILDVGCGDGVLLEAVARRFPEARLSGIDLSESDIALARRRLADARVDTLQVANALQLPFPPESFDCVVSHMVFMLIPEVEAVLAETHRVLRNGGTLAFIVGNPAAAAERMRELFGAVNEAIRARYERFTPLNPADPRIFDTAGIRSLMEGAGFHAVQQREFAVQAQFNGDELYERLLRRYYIGSLPEGDLSAIKAVTDTFAAPSFEYEEPLRLVIAER